MRSTMWLQNFDGNSMKAMSWYEKIGKFIFYLPQLTLNIIVLHIVPNWSISRPYYLTFVLFTQLTPFKTIRPNFFYVYPVDSFQDHMTELIPFKTIWPNFFINVYPIDSFQDNMTWFLHCVPTFINVYPTDSFQDHMT